MFMADGKPNVLKKDVLIIDLEMVEKHLYNRYILTISCSIENVLKKSNFHRQFAQCRLKKSE